LREHAAGGPLPDFSALGVSQDDVKSLRISEGEDDSAVRATHELKDQRDPFAGRVDWFVCAEPDLQPLGRSLPAADRWMKAQPDCQ